MNIDTTVIETSAKKNTGINYKGNEEGNSQTCLKDYLLDLFDEQQKQPETSIFEKAAGVAKKHPAISIGAAVTLATVFVVTPLVIFKNHKRR